MTHKVNYDLRRLVRVYLGLNGIPLERKADDPSLVYGVVKTLWGSSARVVVVQCDLILVSSSPVSIRSGWVFGETFSPDIAIARLSRRVKFGEYVSPICVPASLNDIEDVPKSDKQVMKVGRGGEILCNT